MASKNLLPVAALCSALATGMPVAALAPTLLACSGKHFGLGVPPSLHEQLDSRGYRALEHSGRPPNGMHYLHMARSCN